MNHYVYRITNLINGKKYIGKRSCKCKIENDKYMGSGILIKKAITKYGLENFKKEILVICDTDEEAYIKEMEEIEKVKAWSNPLYYNVTNGGRGAGTGESNHWYGKAIPDEIKLKISKKLKNRYVGESNPFYGKKHSEETKRKYFIGESNPMYGRVGKLNPFYGKTHTKEAIQKIILANKRRCISKETREKLRNASMGENNHFYGRHHSEETKKKLSDSMSGGKSVSSKKVAMFDKDSEVLINTFGSAREASRWLCKEGGHTNISLVCNGKRQTAYGYKWKYLEGEEI